VDMIKVYNNYVANVYERPVPKGNGVNAPRSS
jgi:hypothetical protein